MSISDRNIDKNARVAIKDVNVAMPAIVVSKTERPFKRLRPGFRTRLMGLTADCWDVTGSVAVKVKKMPSTLSGLLHTVGLAIDAVPEKFQFGLHVGAVAGVLFEKAATTAKTFTAAHVITANKFGVILVQETVAGVVSTKVPLSPQAYNDAASALAALPAPDADNIAIGYIAIANNAGDWTANTDDLTNGSDVTTATFNNTPVPATVVDLLDSAVSFADGALAEATLNTDNTKLVVEADEDYVLQYTSDGTGALVAGFLDLFYRPYPLARG